MNDKLNQAIQIGAAINGRIYDLVALFMKFAIVRPAAVLFIFALASIAINGGFHQSSKSVIETVVSLVELGPAEQGYINLESCADDKPAVSSDTMPVPITCANVVTEAVPVDLLAGQLVKVMLTCYLVAVVFGVVFSFFFSRPLRIADVRVLGTARLSEGAAKIDNKAN
ncbi:hypothetical protein [Vibrio alginolyticus]|uniref:hypothetical protein n=1 Tax=Vibrio alginolyticus TaxID=663 RepID=UPI0022AACA07|nr:hypothetical protein [Vibrio alginolyticus]MCZ2802854.1 hypothetical protein [Vibrio alginolyticus]